MRHSACNNQVRGNIAMWCTRWFLPLLLLPLPTAQPYFLILFLFCLTINSKPCFYCIVLLTTIFVSSCYWQPLPLDSPLSHPWADNITTFAEALNSTLSEPPKKPIPDFIRTIDRCWCDFSFNNVFEPFNVTHWEYLSVLRLKDSLEQDTKKSQMSERNGTAPTSDFPHDAAALTSQPSVPQRLTWRRVVKFALRSAHQFFEELLPGNTTKTSLQEASILPPAGVSMPQAKSAGDLPLIREKYDLRPYGLGIIVDFSWPR